MEGKNKLLFNVSIYCIIEETTKIVTIGYTEQPIKSNAVVIETHTKKSSLYCKWRVHELYQEYILSGYTPNSSYKPLQWVLLVKLSFHTGNKQLPRCKACIKLKTSANVEYTVMEFNTIEEANIFVASNTIGTVIRKCY